MSLFDAEPGSILVHACNAEGIWGSGIAAQIKKRYPKAYERYSIHCSDIGPSILGFSTQANILNDKHQICNMITSSIDSKGPDDIETILINTTLALDHFLNRYTSRYVGTPIYSNKFNSGIFNVPWERTEKVLKVLTDRYNVEWTVCEYESTNS